MYRLYFSFSFICLFLFSINGFSQPTHRGVVRYPAEKNKPMSSIDLSGEWQFYYGAFLSAKEMRSLKPQDIHYVSVPSNWATTPVNGKKPSVFGCGTYYLRILLDSSRLRDDKSYAFYIGDITTAYKLYVNDRFVMKCGNATPDPKGFQPMYCPGIGSLYSEKDTLDVILHVSNYFCPNYTGISRSIFFGTEDTIQSCVLLRRTFSVVLLTIYLFLFCFQLLAFFTDRKEKSHLLIALLSVFFASMILLDGDICIFHFFPHFSYFTGYRIWFLTFCAISLVLSLIRQAFPRELSLNIEKAAYVLYGILALLFFTLPFDVLFRFLYFVVILSLIWVIYLVYVLGMAVVRKRPNSVVHLISFFVMLVFFVKDLIFVAKPDKFGFWSQIGVCLYALTQSVLVWLKFSNAHKLTFQLRRKLETINRNLEKTVDERTEELQKTNARLDKVNRQKDFIISSISHDLKNSFNILLNFSKMMAEESNLDDGQRKIMETMSSTAQKGYSVLRNVLSWAKVQVTDYAETAPVDNLSAIVERNLSFFEDTIRKKDLKVSVNIDKNMVFTCNKDQLESILRNLISNAVKFSKPGGCLTVYTQRADDKIEITIHDEGIGMSAEMQQTIFDSTINNRRPGTTGEEGAGMGLLIVKELVESNSGTITCRSDFSTGTDFIVAFPRI
jgi:signal transduction histidine kinase